MFAILLGASYIQVFFAAFVSSVLGLLGWILVEEEVTKRRYRFPPIVPGLPFLGNTFQFPKTDQGPYLKRLGDKYGEMFTLKFGRTYWVVLNSRRVAHELLDKRAAIYSSRQSLPMAHDIVSGGNRMLLMPYGDKWRRQRRMMHHVLGAGQKAMFKPFQDRESKTLMFRLLESPQTWYLSTAQFSGSVIMSVIFGYRPDSRDRTLSAILNAQEQFVPYMMPGSSIVDTFPLLARIPVLKSLQPWRWKGDKIHNQTTQVFSKLIDDLEVRKRQRIQKPCFMTELLDSNDKENFTPNEIAYIAGTLIEAGTDTTRTSMLELVAGTAMYPEWIDLARKELDAVCGANAERLPTFDDFDQLPMIKAAIKESVRWRPTNSQTGIPHALTTDDEFEGYRFPAGTVVTWNNWGISFSPEEYDEPEKFLPSRFLDEDIDKVTKGHLGFGAGRRLCVGYNVAASNLFIAIARLVYCFDIQQDPAHPVVVDKPFPLSAEKEPFKVIIKPRSEAYRRLVEKEYEAAALAEGE